MNAKFFSDSTKDDKTTLELGVSKDNFFKIRIAEHYDSGDVKSYSDVHLSNNELFELIGYLLRIQSKLRKEANNG